MFHYIDSGKVRQIKIRESMNTNILLLSTILLCLSLPLWSQTTLDKEEQPKPTEGVCFAKSVTPDKFKIVEEQVEIEAAHKKESFVPAIYDTIRQQMLIRESHYKMVTYDAVFDTIEIEIKTKAEAKVIQENYETIYQVERKPQTEGSDKGGQWEKTQIPNCKSPNPKDCETMRWVEKKPEFEIKQKEILVTAEWADTTEKAETRIVKKIREKTPARVEKIFVPAEYETIEKIVLKNHARKIVVEIPAKYKTIKTKKLIEKGGKMVWVEVICPDALNEIVISQVQLALKGRRFYEGDIDGKMNNATQKALESFQNSVSLPVGKLDKQTIEALGFNYVIFSKPLNFNEN